MWKNHTLEWVFLRFTAIWSIFYIFFLLFSFLSIIGNNVIIINNYNLINLSQIVWEIWTYYNFNLFLRTLMFSSLIILSFHMYLGCINILQDYVHNNKTYNFVKALTFLTLVEILKHMYILIFLL